LIAIDTSSFRRFLSGEEGPDVDLVVSALRSRRAALPPLAVTELLSEPTMEESTRAAIAGIRVLPLHERYWERTGLLRAQLIAKGLKARVADCLIAQSCIDNDAPLITFDRDFRHFASAGLILLSRKK
jgi:predicted nucleic acid-binding protein